MKILLFVGIFTFLLSNSLMAQQERSIIDELNTKYANQGSVVVLQDESINGILGKYHKVDSTSMIHGHDLYSNYVTVEGYKILVFAGNNQNKSKIEAENKLNQVRQAFPRQEVLLVYQAPFWRVLAGNFLTRNEAEEVLSQMKKHFSSFGKEMYIVDKQKVKRPAY